MKQYLHAHDDGSSTLELTVQERLDGRWELFVPIRGRVHGGDRVHLVGATRDRVTEMLAEEIQARIKRRVLPPDTSADVVAIPRHPSEMEKTDALLGEQLHRAAEMALRLRARSALGPATTDDRVRDLASVPTETLLRRTGIL